ncbi:uncharacterized protein DNG_04146 [Cephalotrichum gorgonifer]|uniref:DUF890 domain-containing protein n=1 Tax=Cephalotrichum gorgonifer TaxID=2041049 RepID=A0AAE8MXE9_9PEZI|nr:uncharacterized protein DNG_04146 [Cephalotrichum gorgonifer]
MENVPPPSRKRAHSSLSDEDASRHHRPVTMSADPAPEASRPKRPPPGVDADTYFHNLYRTEIDFRQLALEDPSFAKLLKQGHLDFNDPSSVVQLTRTLLKVDYGLEIELPPDRLCPPVPNRHNYILWLKGLMDSTSDEDPGKSRVRGIDVGTGSSCIYPLLGCTQRAWEFIATDIDETNLEYAKRNIALNNLEDRIRLVPRTSSDTLIPLDDLEDARTADFVMTNPPFYESADELDALARKKSRPPLTACTGAPVEMVTAGGEVGFARRLVAESRRLRGRVRWYSTMLGKFSSVETVVEMVRGEAGVENYAVTEFIQGAKTRRWAVAWSFGDRRPSGDVARGMKEVSWGKVLPPRTEYEIALPQRPGLSAAVVGRCIDELMGGLALTEWRWDAEKLTGLGRSRENVWSRAWRRRQQRIEAGVEEAPPETEGGDAAACAIGFRISVVVGLDDYTVVFRWVQGCDAALMASLLAFLRSRVEKFKGVEGLEMYIVK